MGNIQTNYNQIYSIYKKQCYTNLHAFHGLSLLFVHSFFSFLPITQLTHYYDPLFCLFHLFVCLLSGLTLKPQKPILIWSDEIRFLCVSFCSWGRNFDWYRDSEKAMEGGLYGVFETREFRG